MPISPNAESIAVWNEILVPKFTRFRAVLDGILGAHGAVALERNGPAPGARVLDVGCGFGESTLALATRVGLFGRVVGTDCCQGFLDVAEGDAARAGVRNVRFVLADAQVHRFSPPFDLCFSRFGTMFFGNTVAALRNLRRALAPDGRLVMVVWRRLEDNPWMELPKRIARTYLPPPAEDAPRCGPGPFSLADADTVADMLRTAGYVEVAFERVDLPVTVGATVEQAVEFQLLLGPAGEVIREAEAEGDARRPQIVAELRQALADFVAPSGVVMPSSSWVVSAAAEAELPAAA